MNIESEMKFKISNSRVMEDAIIASGFNFIKEIYQEDYYYSPAHKSFVGTKKYYLRLRKQDDDSCSFAFHEVIDDLKTKELEVKVNGASNFFKILKKLDFVLDCVVKKKRKVFKNDFFEIVLDRVKELGTFIELEYIGNKKVTMNDFDKLIKKLNINKINLIAGLGYPDLLMAKTKR